MDTPGGFSENCDNLALLRPEGKERKNVKVIPGGPRYNSLSKTQETQPPETTERNGVNYEESYELFQRPGGSALRRAGPERPLKPPIPSLHSIFHTRTS